MGKEPGTPQLEDGFTRVANEILEAIAQTPLSDYESRCVHFLWRKTWGWQDKHGDSKKSDAISHGQWSKGTNIARRHVPRVLDRLVQRNIFSKQVLHISSKKIIAWGFNKYYLQWLTPLFEPPPESIEGVPPTAGAASHEVPPSQGAERSQVPPIQDQLPPIQGAKVPPKQGTTKDKKDTIQKIYYNGEEKVLKLLETLKGWKYEEEEDLQWWRDFRADNNGAGLGDIKACQNYFSGKPAPKHKGIWKNRFRNWLIKKREFARKGPVRSAGKMGEHGLGKVPTTDELKAQAKKKGVL